MLEATKADDEASSTSTPAAQRLPCEIVLQIYSYLPPLEFDAARHTCRFWFSVSLDIKLLYSYLARGRWLGASSSDLKEAAANYAFFWGKRAEESGDVKDYNVNVEWLLSKRLAAESRLSAQWAGSGIRNLASDSLSAADRGIPISIIKPPGLGSLPLQNATPPQPPAVFTVSECMKYVMLSLDRVVYVYNIESFKAGTRPITSLFCHRRVLHVSMNTSYGRNAVAVLLEGRTGVCCDTIIPDPDVPRGKRLQSSMSLSDFRKFDIPDSDRRSAPTPQEPVHFDLYPTTRVHQSPMADLYRRRGHPLGRSSDSISVVGTSLALSDSNYHHGFGEFNSPIPNSYLNHFFPEKLTEDWVYDAPNALYPFDNLEPLSRTPVPIELGTRKIYRNLCTVQDPPTSVAICPQKQCVAFGCKNGVELHWVDSVRGSTLSRWFPLAAPSDFLSFVPPRDGEQEGGSTKLRLISSAAGPEPFVDADHYRAVPLSDGHVLYTDPDSGHLFLGIDRPGGPNKLSREVRCLPPGGRSQGTRPDCYAAGFDVRWGVRIVAVYGVFVMLYVLAADDFERARPTTPGFQVAQSDLAMDFAVGGIEREPHCLQGALLRILDNPSVQDIGVDSRHGGVKVWLFLRPEPPRRRSRRRRPHAGWSSSSHNLSIHHS